MSERPEHHNPVPDPPRPTPRWFFVRRMQGMFFGGILFTALHLPLCLGLLGWIYVLSGRVSPLTDIRLDRDHASTTAVITHTKLLSHIHMGSRHPWEIAFRFASPDGLTIEATGYTYDQSFAGKTTGDEIKVEYDPADPARARPAGGSASATPLWVYLLIIAVTAPEFLIGVMLLIVVARRARQERILLAYGAAAVADVVRVEKSRYIHFGKKHPYDVVYRFRDDRGLEVAGRDRTYHYAWAEALKPEDKVGVVYNPRSPQVNVLWLHGSDIWPTRTEQSAAGFGSL